MDSTPGIWRTRHNRCTRRCFCRHLLKRRRSEQWDPPPSWVDCALPFPETKERFILPSPFVWDRRSSYLFVDMRDRRGQLQTVQQVVSIIIVHFEVMQLQLLRRHLFLWFVYDSFQMLHDVANKQTKAEVRTNPDWGHMEQAERTLTPDPGPCSCPDACAGWVCGLHCPQSVAAAARKAGPEKGRVTGRGGGGGAHLPSAGHTCCFSFWWKMRNVWKNLNMNF